MMPAISLSQKAYLWCAASPWIMSPDREFKGPMQRAQEESISDLFDRILKENTIKESFTPQPLNQSIYHMYGQPLQRVAQVVAKLAIAYLVAPAGVVTSLARSSCQILCLHNSRISEVQQALDGRTSLFAAGPFIVALSIRSLGRLLAGGILPSLFSAAGALFFLALGLYLSWYTLRSIFSSFHSPESTGLFFPPNLGGDALTRLLNLRIKCGWVNENDSLLRFNALDSSYYLFMHFRKIRESQVDEMMRLVCLAERSKGSLGYCSSYQLHDIFYSSNVTFLPFYFQAADSAVLEEFIAKKAAFQQIDCLNETFGLVFDQVNRYEELLGSYHRIIEEFRPSPPPQPQSQRFRSPTPPPMLRDKNFSDSYGNRVRPIGTRKVSSEYKRVHAIATKIQGGADSTWREVLGFNANQKVSLKDLEKKFRSLSRKLHTDKREKNDSEEDIQERRSLFQLVNEAHEQGKRPNS